MQRTIVLFHPGALGDVLLAVPAVHWLRDRFPGRQVVFISGEPVGRLLLECGLIDTWMSFHGDAVAELLARPSVLTGELKSHLARCDLAVGWMQDADGSLADLFRRYGARASRVLSPFSPRLHAKHQSERFLEALGEAESRPPRPIPFVLPVHSFSRARVSLEACGVDFDQSYALLHPSSGSPHKCAGPTVLAQMVEAVRTQGATPLILEGPADQRAVAAVLRDCPEQPSVLRGLDLCTLAAILARASLFVGHDSGVTHLAGLLGVRTVALFGPTDPARWAPRGSNVIVATGEPCICRSWEAVVQCTEKPCLRVPIDSIVSAAALHGVMKVQPLEMS